MAKLTLEQRITKVHEAIAKEEKIIECSKEKIKSLNSELKSLKAEKEKIFANEVLKLLKGLCEKISVNSKTVIKVIYWSD